MTTYEQGQELGRMIRVNYIEPLETRIRELEAAIDEYILWEPGREGHAAAHRRLVEVRRREMFRDGSLTGETTT